MATQNFIGGGYYGKMGATVGQRWKNKRIIRSYVVPKNPRTERQQANRSVFALCTRYSQIAMQMNFRAPCFQSEITPEWGLRMKTALTLKKNGRMNEECIPVIPIDYSPLYFVQTLAFVSKTEDGTITLRPAGTLPAENRSLSAWVAMWDDQGEEKGEGLHSAEFISGENPLIKIYNVENFDETQLSIFLMVSNDDKSFQNSTFYCGAQRTIENSIFEGNIFSASELPDGNTYTFDGDTLKTTSENAEFIEDTFKVI